MLVSGEMDENVQASHTLALAHALIEAERDFDLLIVPNAGHDVLMASGYAHRRVWDFFVRHLLNRTPPEGFALRFERAEVAAYGRAWIRELWH